MCTVSMQEMCELHDASHSKPCATVVQMQVSGCTSCTVWPWSTNDLQDNISCDLGWDRVRLPWAVAIGRSAYSSCQRPRSGVSLVVWGVVLVAVVPRRVEIVESGWLKGPSGVGWGVGNQVHATEPPPTAIAHLACSSPYSSG